MSGPVLSRNGSLLPGPNATLDPNCSLSQGLVMCCLPGISKADMVNGRFYAQNATCLPRPTPWGMGMDFAPSNWLEYASPNPLPDCSGGWTLAAGVFLDGTSGTAAIIGEFYSGGSDPVSFEIGFGISTGVNVEAGNYSGSAWTIASSGAAATTNVPLNIVGVHNLNTIKIFNNGREAGSVTATGPFSDGNEVRIGRRHDGSAFVDGAIAYAMIWNRGLTDPEVKIQNDRPFVMFR